MRIRRTSSEGFFYFNFLYFILALLTGESIFWICLGINMLIFVITIVIGIVQDRMDNPNGIDLSLISIEEYRRNNQLENDDNIQEVNQEIKQENYKYY